jgi:hypothetical protein
VIAVFDTAFYCRLNRSIICIGPSGFPRGPINIETEYAGSDSWRRIGIVPGVVAWCANHRLHIGNVEFPAQHAFTWHPPVVLSYRAENLERGEAVAASIAAARAPADSVASIGRTQVNVNDQSTTVNAVLRNAIAAACAELTRWLVAVVHCPDRPLPASKWTSLIGLGRGLTPSGDDLLGGAMVAFSAYGAEIVRRRLAGVVCHEMNARTSLISAAHLRLAAQGQGGEALHALIAALVSGQAARIKTAVAGLERVGHTSGWDMLAGVLLAAHVLRETAWLHN